MSELKRLNDEVLENQINGDNLLKDSENFKKQYAAVLLQLNEVNEQAGVLMNPFPVSSLFFFIFNCLFFSECIGFLCFVLLEAAQYISRDFTIDVPQASAGYGRLLLSCSRTQFPCG